MTKAIGATRQGSLTALCRVHGIAAEYEDIWGKVHHASYKTNRAVLDVLGVADLSNPDAALEDFELSGWTSPLPPVAVFRRETAPYRLRFHFSERNLHATYRWTFKLEGGEIRTVSSDPNSLRRCASTRCEIRATMRWRSTGTTHSYAAITASRSPARASG